MPFPFELKAVDGPARTGVLRTTRGEMLAWGGQLLAPQGRWLALKGRYPDDELAELPAPFRLEAVHALRVPGLDAERHLVVLRRA